MDDELKDLMTTSRNVSEEEFLGLFNQVPHLRNLTTLILDFNQVTGITVFAWFTSQRDLMMLLLYWKLSISNVQLNLPLYSPSLQFSFNSIHQDTAPMVESSMWIFQVSTNQSKPKQRTVLVCAGHNYFTVRCLPEDKSILLGELLNGADGLSRSGCVSGTKKTWKPPLVEVSSFIITFYLGNNGLKQFSSIFSGGFRY